MYVTQTQFPRHLWKSIYQSQRNEGERDRRTGMKTIKHHMFICRYIYLNKPNIKHVSL